MDEDSDTFGSTCYARTPLAPRAVYPSVTRGTHVFADFGGSNMINPYYARL